MRNEMWVLLPILIILFTFSSICYALGNVLWESKTSSMLSDSVLVVDGKVYAAGSDKHLYCWDDKTGDKTFKKRFKHRLYYSPIIGDNAIYLAVPYTSNKLYALNPDNGDELWSVKTSKKTTKPIFFDDYVYIGADKHVLKIDAANGDVVDRLKIPDNVASVGLFDSKIVVASIKGEVAIYSVEFEEIANWSAVSGSLFVTSSNESLFVVNRKGIAYRLDKTLDTEWEVELGNQVNLPLIENGNSVFIILANGEIQILNARTGTSINSLNAGENIYCASAYRNGLIYVTEYGNALVIEDTLMAPADFATFDKKVVSPGIVAGNSVYISDIEGHVFRIEAKNNEQ